MRNLLHHMIRLPRNAILGCIGLYQHTLSPDHGPLRHMNPYGYCRHHPTCSMYAKQKIEEHGALIGSLLACRHVLTCHPFRTPDPERIREAMERTEI